MSGRWKLNGRELFDTAVRIFPTGLSYRQTVRQATVAIHGGTEYREKTGKDLPRPSIAFVFLGSGTQKYVKWTEMFDVLDDDEVWTLEAPADDPVYVYKNEKRAAFATENYRADVEMGVARIGVAVDAILDGVWVVDGGSYCERVTGHFELDSTGPSVYIRDDGTNTGATPVVRLPAQYTAAGYPLAVRASDYAEVQPTLVGTVTVDGQPYEEYDMTGFLIPAPTTAGDVGLYRICSSPSLAFLDSLFTDDAALGIGELMIAEGEIGE